VKAAFGLFDVDSDGFIELEEMAILMKSMFTMMSFCNAGLFEKLDTTPGEMAEQTALEAFETLGLKPGVDQMGLQAFVDWYKSGEGSGSLGGSGGYGADEESGMEDEEDEKKREDDSAASGDGEGALKAAFTMAKTALGFDCIAVDDLLEILSEAAPDDTLTEKQFLVCLSNIAALAGKDGYGAESESAEQLGRVIFAAFDDAGTDAVDFAELTSGLSVLCNSSPKDKVITTFTIHDGDGDGHLSYTETVHLISCIFKVLFVIGDLGPHFGISAEQLAVITTAQAFSDVELNDGLISVGELLLHFTALLPGM
ncbi:hypothetical protein TeGR_g12199, partial [Tetraparma gracilis]